MNERMRNGECGMRNRRSRSPLRVIPHSAIRTPHSAMTLVELLVAMAIISILAALLVGVAATAGATAREARTKSLVARLHTLLADRYDSYRARRVELNTRDVNGNGQPDWLDRVSVDRSPSDGASDLTGIPLTGLDPRQAVAVGRLVGIRELMKLEMPDRWADVALWPAVPTGALPAVSITQLRGRLRVLESPPPLHYAYLRKYNEMAAAGVTVEDALENQSAECLYLVIVNATADGEARGLFKEADVGDTDGDGALEFLDGWGQPIRFLRWAPGFDSDAQPSVASLRRVYEDASGAAGAKRSAVQQRLGADHDPFDLFRVDQANLAAYNPTEPANRAGPRGWRLAPLVISAGQDETLGYDSHPEHLAALDPYAPVNDGGAAATPPVWLGENDPAEEEAYADDVHSHAVGGFVRAR